MYLLLVDNNYNLSKEITNLLTNNSISCEVVNCASRSALIDLASKISPHLVIVDFDLFSNSSVDIIKDLRRSSPGTYVMAIVDSDHYDTLNQAIEAGMPPQPRQAGGKPGRIPKVALVQEPVRGWQKKRCIQPGWFLSEGIQVSPGFFHP